MAQFEFDGILLETGLLQTGFHAAGDNDINQGPPEYDRSCDCSEKMSVIAYCS